MPLVPRCTIDVCRGWAEALWQRGRWQHDCAGDFHVTLKGGRLPWQKAIWWDKAALGN